MPASIPASLPASILVVRLGAIGDVTNALVFATAVKRAAPRTRIAWAVHPLSFPLVEGHPSVDRVHLWPRGGGLQGLALMAREIRRERYDLAVDLQRIAKSSLLARLSGAPRVLGFDRRRSKELSWLLTGERIAAGSRREHMVEQYLAFARHLGIEGPMAERVLPADEAAEAWADALVAELGAAPILIHVSASRPRKRWPPERYGALARACGEVAGAPVCLTGGPEDRGDAAAALAAAVSLDGAGPLAAGSRSDIRDLAGQTTLRQLICLAARSRLYVGGDTGAMHLAAAVGTPVVALFGPGDPARTGPYGEGHRVVRVPPYAGPAEPLLEGSIEDVDVELVMASVREALVP